MGWNDMDAEKNRDLEEPPEVDWGECMEWPHVEPYTIPAFRRGAYLEKKVKELEAERDEYKRLIDMHSKVEVDISMKNMDLELIARELKDMLTRRTKLLERARLILAKVVPHDLFICQDIDAELKWDGE